MSNSNAQQFQKEFPLHWAIWHNDIGKLSELLDNQSDETYLETQDPRGRTPLMLSVVLGHCECAKILLRHSADANAENKTYWSVSHEAVATGDPELLLHVIQHRDYQRNLRSKRAAASLLAKLRDTPDFYAEMGWEFASWIPFVSKMCPSDTYKVYKKGSTVRIDTTLIGFDATQQWQRGNQTLLFRGSEDGRFAEISIVDHQLRTVFSGEKWEVHNVEGAENLEEEGGMVLDDFRPFESDIADRLTNPIVTTYVDVENIAFERAKSGIPGWRSEKNETVKGYPCKVYTATNVELITKTRTEHLTERDKAEQETRNSTPMDSLLKYVQGTETKLEDKEVDPSSSVSPQNPSGIKPEEYFNAMLPLPPDRDIGRPKKIGKRSQTFKAHLWLSNEFPLSLPEQITPIIDLMAANNAHFARLKNFIELQLPAGFPVKIEIPLFHVITAMITFGNVFAEQSSVDGVSVVYEESENETEPGRTQKKCVIDPKVFQIPSDYRRMDQSGNPPVAAATRGGPHPNRIPGQHGSLWGSAAEEDMLLQFAIQQSLASADQLPEIAEIDHGTPLDPSVDVDLQRAINLSLGIEEPQESIISSDPASNGDSSLRAILEISKREEEIRQKKIAEEEEEELKRAIEASLQEK